MRDPYPPLLGNGLAQAGAADEDSGGGEDQQCAVFGAVDYAAGQVIFHST
jgi:hypothetical protein